MSIEEIIKYEGSNRTFIWKHPKEDFNIGSQLIVHESQEAILFLNGLASNTFTAGRYTLETQNIPFLKNIINLSTGNKTSFHAEVYFINKTEQMGIKWGTDSKILFLEPTYKFPLSLGASGEMSLHVEDSRKLLMKIVGTEKGLSQEGLIYGLKSFLMLHVKSILPTIIMNNSIDIFTIDTRLPVLSDLLKKNIAPLFEDYGVVLETFLVTTIVRPDGDETYERFKTLYFRQYADVEEAKIRQNVSIVDQQTEAQKKIIEAEALAKKRVIEGYTYQQERGYDIAKSVAENVSVGEFSNLGIGLGMMSGFGGTLGGYVSNITRQTLYGNSLKRQFCSECGIGLDADAKFCSNCGKRLSKEENTCINCGYIFTDNERFCPECGKQR